MAVLNPWCVETTAFPVKFGLLEIKIANMASTTNMRIKFLLFNLFFLLTDLKLLKFMASNYNNQ
jgi:hypothetical protein